MLKLDLNGGTRHNVPIHQDNVHWMACRYCIERRKPCVMVLYNTKPVILPLPVGDRGSGATPRDLGYYIKV